MLNKQTAYDLIGAAGAIAVIVGCGMIYMPAGIIIGGLMALAIALLGARK